jgi:hypothetical protein
MNMRYKVHYIDTSRQSPFSVIERKLIILPNIIDTNRQSPIVVNVMNVKYYDMNVEINAMNRKYSIMSAQL